MNRYAIYHCGLDRNGHRHWRMKTHTAVRNCRQQAALFPRIVVVTRPRPGQVVWRTGLQRRRWYAMTARVRADRRSFVTTLTYPALVSPIPPTFR